MRKQWRRGTARAERHGELDADAGRGSDCDAGSQSDANGRADSESESDSEAVTVADSDGDINGGRVPGNRVCCAATRLSDPRRDRRSHGSGQPCFLRLPSELVHRVADVRFEFDRTRRVRTGAIAATEPARAARNGTGRRRGTARGRRVSATRSRDDVHDLVFRYRVVRDDDRGSVVHVYDALSARLRWSVRASGRRGAGTTTSRCAHALGSIDVDHLSLSM